MNLEEIWHGKDPSLRKVEIWWDGQWIIDSESGIETPLGMRNQYPGFTRRKNAISYAERNVQKPFLLRITPRKTSFHPSEAKWKWIK